MVYVYFKLKEFHVLAGGALGILLGLGGAYAVSRLEFFGRNQISALFLAVYEREHETTMRVLRAFPTDRPDLRPVLTGLPVAGFTGAPETTGEKMISVMHAISPP